MQLQRLDLGHNAQGRSSPHGVANILLGLPHRMAFQIANHYFPAYRSIDSEDSIYCGRSAKEKELRQKNALDLFVVSLPA